MIPNNENKNLHNLENEILYVKNQLQYDHEGIRTSRILISRLYNNIQSNYADIVRRYAENPHDLNAPRKGFVTLSIETPEVEKLFKYIQNTLPIFAEIIKIIPPLRNSIENQRDTLLKNISELSEIYHLEMPMVELRDAFNIGKHNADVVQDKMASIRQKSNETMDNINLKSIL